MKIPFFRRGEQFLIELNPLPSSLVGQTSAEVRGWIASDTPITTVALSFDGRHELVSDFHDRPDVRVHHAHRYVVGWAHTIVFGPLEALPKTLDVGVYVNTELRLTRKIHARAVGLQDEVPDIATEAPQSAFRAGAESLTPEATVLEIGTKRHGPDPTHHMHFFPNVLRQNYLMADVAGGEDVDVVVDAHELPDSWATRFDACVAWAVWEHLRRPWIAAQQLYKVLKPGGFCFIDTHQTFVLHGYPQDFFRFSREALQGIFEDAGFKVSEAGYRHRAQIIPPEDVLSEDDVDEWNRRHHAYLNVCLFATKPLSR